MNQTSARVLVVLLLLLITTTVAAAPSSGTVTLGWSCTPGADPAVLVTLYRAVGCGSYSPLATMPVTDQRYTDATVPLGTLVCWQAVGEDAHGVDRPPSTTVAVLCQRQGQRVRCTPQ
jgi:hypothetical protein